MLGISANVSSQNYHLQHENDRTSLLTWNRYLENIPTDINFIGFTLTFFYPKSIILLDIVDNCRCVGIKINNKTAEDDPAWRKVNSPYWCVCMADSTFSIENEIKNYKSHFKFDVVANRKIVRIDNDTALSITLTKSNNEFLIQNIYFKKFGTAFEINNEKGLSSDYELFLRSLKIERNKNYTR
jgi:hypothetical protein